MGCNPFGVQRDASWTPTKTVIDNEARRKLIIPGGQARAYDVLKLLIIDAEEVVTVRKACRPSSVVTPSFEIDFLSFC